MTRKNPHQACLQVPGDLYSTLNSSEVQLLAGQKQLTARIVQNNDIPASSVLPSLDIYMNKKLSAQLKYTEMELNYCILSGSQLRIGPLVGVLVGRKTYNEYPLPTGREARIYKEMTLAARHKKIFIYFFYADGVDWKRKVIRGHIYAQKVNKKAGWMRGTFPLPDIIYNRIAYRYMERNNIIQKLINKADAESIYLFNSRFLDKWEVHETLYMDPHTRPMIPEGANFSEENLSYCVDKFDTLFIKPIDGSVGKGIIQVKVSNNGLISFSKLGSKKGWQQCRSVEELYKQLNIVDKKKYIIQKGINLAKIAGNIFDIRVQVQKNGYGAWTFTGAGVRIAAPGNFVTHVPNGGSKAGYEPVIKEVFGDSNEIMKSLERQLKTICQTVPLVLEHGLGISLAVLSMDLGIDTEGRMWIIEVNSKPASFDENDIRQRHLSLLNDYLLYKSNFIVE